LPLYINSRRHAKNTRVLCLRTKNGNIINDNNDDDNNKNNTLEITGVDKITGVDETNSINHTNTEMEMDTNHMNTEMDTTNNNNTLEITGVYNNTTETETTNESQDISNEPYTAPHTYTNNEQDDAGHNQDKNYEQYDDEISIEDESPEDIHITINGINTVHEINAGQLHVDPDTREEMETEIQRNTPTHRYDLRPRLTKRNQKYNMVSIGRQSTIAKPHLYIMLNQVGIREGLKKFGNQGNNALLKELSQLHQRDMLLPRKKEDMTYKERKKALR